MATEQSKKTWNIIFQILKIAVTAAVLLFFGSKLNFASLKSSYAGMFADGRWAYLLLAIILDGIIVHTILVVRWMYCLRAYNINISFWKLLEYQFISDVYSVVLPGSMGGDVVRALFLFQTEQKGHIVNSVVIARVFGLAILAVCVIVTFIFYAPHLDSMLSTALFPLLWQTNGGAAGSIQRFILSSPKTIIILSIVFLSLVLLFFAAVIGWNEQIRRFIDAHEKTTKFLKAIKLYTIITSLDVYKKPEIFWPTTACSIVGQVGFIMEFWLMFRAAGFYGISLGYCFLTISIVFLISLIPVSMFGIGLREFSIGLFMTQLSAGWLLGQHLGSDPSVALIADYLKAHPHASFETLQQFSQSNAVNLQDVILFMQRQSLNDIVSVTAIYYFLWLLTAIVGVILITINSIKNILARNKK